jgi:SAM-dependent methyltransferase
MHPEALHFTRYVKDILPTFFRGRTVLDVGSGDINGNNRHLFENCVYEGNDVVPAPNVSVVARTGDLTFPDAFFDTIVSTECFEHDPEFARSWRAIYRMLRPGGLFAFTCASTGRLEHGTRREGGNQSYGTRARIEDMQDYYRNLTESDLNEVLPLRDLFSSWDTYYNERSKDLYFVGIKKGEGEHDDSVHFRLYQAPGVIPTSHNIAF